jgi:hypothetical protein
MGNVPVNLALVAGTGQRTGGPGYGSYSNGFANPFGTVWFNDFTGAMSIYASGSDPSFNADVASMYSSNDSSLLSSIPLAILVVLAVAVCITRTELSYSTVKQKRKVQLNQTS